jgi:hypothetical protein
MGLRGIATDVTAAGNSPFGRLFAGEDPRTGGRPHRRSPAPA